jgi:hypothetical protein
MVVVCEAGLCIVTCIRRLGKAVSQGGLAFCRTKHDPAAIRGAFIRWWGCQIMAMICDSFIQTARDVEEENMSVQGWSALSKNNEK